MIDVVELSRFRGFERLQAHLLPHAYITGPNSAGKSTILEALALAERCLRIGRRKSPPVSVYHQGERRRGFQLPTNGDAGEDPVRHEFGRAEALASVQWANGARVNMVWPAQADGDERGFFYLEDKEGTQPRTPQGTRALFAPITVVPVVTPLDRIEELKKLDYVEAHASTRLASRHFRNHAWQMHSTEQWPSFREFCRAWLPEIQLLDVSLDFHSNQLAVFYSETGSRVPKELAWAGDGIQIWVQLLWHLFRAKEATTVVLDEPDVYLHPDLQRRLARLLESLGAQVVLASHSAELLRGAPDGGILCVDRRLGRAQRAASFEHLVR